MCLMTTTILLAGCHGVATNDAEPTADSNAVTRDWLVGRWATSGDCATAIEYKADGSFPALSGATWTLSGDRLTTNIPNAAPQVSTVSHTGADAMRQTGANGGSRTDFTRCH